MFQLDTISLTSSTSVTKRKKKKLSKSEFSAISACSSLTCLRLSQAFVCCCCNHKPFFSTLPPSGHHQHTSSSRSTPHQCQCLCHPKCPWYSLECQKSSPPVSSTIGLSHSCHSVKQPPHPTSQYAHRQLSGFTDKSPVKSTL